MKTQNKELYAILTVVLVLLLIELIILLYCFNNHGLNIGHRKNAEAIPILAYHHFMPKVDKEKYDPKNKYVMSIEQFEEQMHYLQEHGYKTIDSKQFQDWLDNKIELDDKTCMITIDDGNISTYYQILPILKKYQYKAIVFVINNRVRQTSADWDPSKSSFLGEDLILKIKDEYPSLGIASHSNSMHDLISGANSMTVYSYEEIVQDVVKSKQHINSNVYAYPFGNSNDNYQRAVKEAGFAYAFSFNNQRKASRTENRYNLSRININAATSIRHFAKFLRSK